MNTGAERIQTLIVEDDHQLAVMLKTTMTEHGHVVTAAATAEAAFRIARESELDVILLDLGLPDIDGTRLIPMLRDVTRAPIIVISARDTEAQKVVALDAGADDYLTKPFGIDELLARIRSARRRVARNKEGAAEAASYSFRDLTIDVGQRQVTLGERTIHLTPVEFRLICALARHGGKVTTHRQLLREVWGPLHEEDSHYLRIYMRQLRCKIEADPAQPRYLLTEPGVGYRLASE